jgi:methionyl-tRNA formyltransferase
MSDLTLMILCGRSPRHLYVANALCRAGRPLAVVHEVGSDWNLRQLRRQLQPATLCRKAWRWVRDRRRYRDGAEARFFFGAELPRLDRPDLVATVPHINHPDLLMLATRLQPDLIAVFGTSLIRGDLLHQGRLGILNLHGGLSPEYRGADCTFWALYNREPDKIGCALHYIDAGIDTGKLVAHVSPAINGGGDELTLFWQAVKDSAAVYAEAVERLSQGDRLGQAQPHRGRLYQMKQRGLRHELHVARALRAGMLRRVNLPRRVRWFVADESPAVAASALRHHPVPAR